MLVITLLRATWASHDCYQILETWKLKLLTCELFLSLKWLAFIALWYIKIVSLHSYDFKYSFIQNQIQNFFVRICHLSFFDFFVLGKSHCHARWVRYCSIIAIQPILVLNNSDFILRRPSKNIVHSLYDLAQDKATETECAATNSVLLSPAEPCTTRSKTWKEGGGWRGQNGSGKSHKIAYGCGILRILVREMETGFEKTPNFWILYRWKR